ncbi:MAG: histidine--tRNA ligase family protein [Dehalococcoidia bacterium]|nr:histidine--tRNA ligase family protein [Dehalococcoidia bacterium]
MRDLLPVDMARFRRVESAFRDVCLSYGYGEVKPPTIEYLQLFTALGTLTPGMVGRVYSFLDWDGWSGERVVLRPDCTIPVARLYVENLSPQSPERLFYVTNSFVFEKTGEKNRERWQCGAEFIGGAPVAADVEIIMLAREVVGRLGLDGIRLQVCHAGLLKALIDELGLAPSARERLVESVLDGDWSGLEKAVTSVSEDKRYLPPLLSLKGSSAGYLENIKALSVGAGEEFRTALDEFIEVVRLLDEIECTYEVDITAVRSFEYYTGICFQMISDSGEKVGGGGRYDDLIPLMGGPDESACGFALYLDQIMNLLQETEQAGRHVLVVSGACTASVMRDSLELARAIRAGGGVAVVEIEERGEFVSRCGWIAKVGADDTGIVELTNCKTNERKACSIAAAVEQIMS